MEKTWVNIPDVLFFQEGPGVRNTQYTTEGVKLLNVANLVDGKVDLSTSDRYISEEEAYGKYKHFLCNAGDFIIASSGIKVEYIDKKMGFIDESMLPLCMNTSTIRFKVLDDNQLRIRYFMYYLKSQHFKRQLFKQITGSAQLNYGPSHLKKMIMPLIDIRKQDEIVDCMDKIQSIIEMRQQELVCFDELIKARFVEYYEGWKDKYDATVLGEFLEDITYGFTNPMPDAEEGPWKITAKDVVNGIVNLNTARKTSQEAFDELTAKSKPQLGDVLLTKDGTLGRTAVVDVGGICVNQSVAVLRTNGKILPKYLSILLQMPKYQRDMMADAGGGTIKHIYITKVVKMPIIAPTIEEQEEFLQFVKQVDKSKVVVQKALDEAQLLFDSLMQAYFG